ncbi:MAG TPA: asparagine synthase (glutamine-hydrolyzing) [Anaeromyxobacter sp.]|nr:asparagine synthase (glutamine-hydrolyzing) [Anaeromyxobacter sp.]
MCGIGGVIGRVDDANRAAVRRMSTAMAHRGPDGEGFWTSEPDGRHRGVLLVHRRLSILDLSTAAAQPMVDPATGDVLAYNGELYNYLALRDRLAAAGERVHSTGDTEVLLHLLAREGASALPSLRGMFAFGFYDASAGELLLARDPLGIKPLYLARNPDPGGGWSVAFASELRALLASGLLPSPRLDPRAVASVVWNGFVAGPHTAVRGVETLWPGEFRAFGLDGRETRAATYWRLGAPAGGPPGTEERLAAELEECVHRHLASDVPLAVFLSSGVDSSSVAHLAQRTSGTPVHTFTLAFEEKELDESGHAADIARAIGTEHHQVTLTEARFVEHLDAAIDSLDQPTFDGLNSFYMSQAVREAGFKVALVGTGGDELFGGYTSFRDLPRLWAWARATRFLPRTLQAAAAKLVTAALHPRRGAVPPQTRWAKLPEMMRRGDDLLGLYQLAYALFLPDFQGELLAGGVDREVVDGLSGTMRERLSGETRGSPPLRAISVLEQRLFLGERLLRDSDAASMASSLELRLPLVDSVLLQQVDGLPESLRYRPLRAKALLRRLGLRGLDPALFDRPKRGFVLPYDRWIRRSLGAAMDRTLRDPALIAPTGLDPQAVGRLWRAFQEAAPGMYWSRIWAVYVLIRWCHRHRVFL